MKKKYKMEVVILKRMQKRLEVDETKEIKIMSEEIEQRQEEIKQVTKEVKLLKRLQHHQGNRLVDLENPNTFPEKIKHLVEERKFQTDKNQDLLKKLE